MFDIELAKSGVPVFSHSGNSVRIICYDRNGSEIVYLEKTYYNYETLRWCTLKHAPSLLKLEGYENT